MPYSSALPLPTTPFIGREAELAALTAMVTNRQTRCLVLVGPGGVGKTRLALQLADAVAGTFADGAIVVPLAPVRHPDLVLTTIARALGMWEVGDQPIADRLREALRDRDLLLILDNFEHLLPAAPHVADLIAACPKVMVLVTSRARLNLAGEREQVVSPLAVPGDGPAAGDVGDVPSVRLFGARAIDAAPDFTLTAANTATVAAICRRLDGLPLAIELAAAWMRILSPAALLARLDERLPLLIGGPRDLTPRLQSMRDAIGWSYDLLTSEEQTRFRRLAVFTGGFTLDAARAVFSDRDDRHAVLETLVTLSDRSLLRPITEDTGEPRFTMLETIREYGLEQLVASGEEDSIRTGHATYFLALAERIEPDLYGVRGLVQSLDALEREHPNLRGTLDWWERRGDAARQLRLAAALWRFWLMRGYLGEGQAWLERSLRPPDTAPSLRAKALVALALLAWPRHAQEDALTALAQAVDLVEGTTNLDGLALARLAQAWITLDRGDLARAARWATESKTLYEQLGWKWAVLSARTCLARVAFAEGDLRRAETMYESLLGATQEEGDAYGLATARHGLGLLRTARHEYAQALALHVAALRGYQALGERLWIAVCLEAIATDLSAMGWAAPASRVLGAAAGVRTAIGLPTWFADQGALARTRDGARAALGEAGFTAAWAAGAAAPLAEVIAEAVELAASAASRPRVEPPEAGAAWPAGHLTPRELEVLRLLAEGRSNPEIGTVLSISHRTVAGHVEGIFRKLEVDSRAAAAAIAVRRKLI